MFTSTLPKTDISTTLFFDDICVYDAISNLFFFCLVLQQKTALSK